MFELEVLCDSPRAGKSTLVKQLIALGASVTILTSSLPAVSARTEPKISLLIYDELEPPQIGRGKRNGKRKRNPDRWK